MALIPEVQAYVDTLKFKNEDAKKAFVALIEDPETAESAFLMQADYTKKTQQTATEKKALEDARAAFEDEQEELLRRNNEWKTGIETRLNAALKQAADANLYGAALKNKLQVLAAQSGEDPDELLKDVMEMRAEEEKKDTPAAPVYDPEALKKDYVSRQEYEAAMSNVALFPIEFSDIRRDYQKLSGKDVDGSLRDAAVTAYQEVAKRRAKGENVTFRTYMEEKLDFKGLREAAATKEREEWEKQTREEIEKNVRSEYLTQNPGAARQSTEPQRDLSAKGRMERGVSLDNSAVDTRTRQQEFHRMYEERAAKRRNDSAAA